MKTAMHWGMVLLLAGTLSAQTASKKKTAAAKVASPPSATAQEVQTLRDALAAQQQQIEALKQAMTQRDSAWQQAQQQLQQAQSEAADAKAKAAAVETAGAQQQEAFGKLSSDMADVKTTLTNAAVTSQDDQKRVSALEGLTGRFRLNGDIRVRGESFFQQNAFDRNRARVRVRFGFDGKLNDSFAAGLSIATGSLGDPTSTNTTLTNFFDKHTIGLDRAWLTYQPGNHKWLQLTGGKFAYTWNRTPVTFDSDLNPEGFSEKISYDLHTKIVKNVSFGLFQMLFNEVSKGTDSFALGGTVSARLQPLGSDFWVATPSFSAVKFNSPDAILQASAFAVQATSTGTAPGATTPVPPVQVPGEGPGCAGGAGLPTVPAKTCAFGPNGITNSTFNDAGGVPHFASQFFYADFILNNTFKTPIKRLPVNLLLEYENNLSANQPFDVNNVQRTDLGKQSHAYYFEVGMGQNRNKGDIQFGYAWLRQEQDSVIASFNESDQRAPTNVIQNRLFGTWRVHPNVTAAFTGWFGRTLNTNLQHAALGPGVTAGKQDNLLKRMQFDLIYSF